MSQVAAQVDPPPSIPAEMIARIVEVLAFEQAWLLGSRAEIVASTGVVVHGG